MSSSFGFLKALWERLFSVWAAKQTKRKKVQKSWFDGESPIEKDIHRKKNKNIPVTGPKMMVLSLDLRT